jgi:CarD family transcriptional regulator
MPAKPAKKAAAAKAKASKSAKPAAKKAKTQKAVSKAAAKTAVRKTAKIKAPAPKPTVKAKPKAKAKIIEAKTAKPAPKAATPAPKPAVKVPVKPAIAAKPAAPAAPPPAPEKSRAAPEVRKDIMTNQAATKKTTNKHGFKTGEHIVYPAHGVGQIVAIEEQEIAGYKLELFVITFAKDKMTLRVPISKIDSVGMRKLSAGDIMERALDTLKGRARVKRTMWSRRAQEYEAKINSGDLVAIAEVVRDLHRAETQPEQSYSERQLYEAALDRMARELAAVEKLTDAEAVKKIEAMLAKGPKRGAAKSEAEAEEAEEGDDTNGDEAEAA